MSPRFAPHAMATLLAGAFLAAAATSATAADEMSMEKCYGVAKAGENSCAHWKGLHSCAGASTMNFNGGDWKLVKAGDCDRVGGAKAPFEGPNPKLSKGL